jgi:mono/diheme cytochrome c family protein
MGKRVAVALVALMLSASSAYAQGVDEGKDLFLSNCRLCHGSDGAAKTAMGKKEKMRDLASPEVQQQSDSVLIRIVTKGKGAMRAQEERLTPEEIALVVSYVRELGKKTPGAKP